MLNLLPKGLWPLGVALALFATRLPAQTSQGQSQEQDQQPAPCSAAEYRQFDFWLGEWDVSADGKPAGRNTITRVQEGCALLEQWTSATGPTGMSLNMYDRTDKHWHQTWVSAGGWVSRLKGRFENGRMVMQSAPTPRRDGTLMIHRWTWSQTGPGQVRQLWEASADQGRTWKTNFDGRYASRKK